RQGACAKRAGPGTGGGALPPLSIREFSPLLLFPCPLAPSKGGQPDPRGPAGPTAFPPGSGRTGDRCHQGPFHPAPAYRVPSSLPDPARKTIAPVASEDGGGDRSTD